MISNVWCCDVTLLCLTVTILVVPPNDKRCVASAAAPGKSTNTSASLYKASSAWVKYLRRCRKPPYPWSKKGSELLVPIPNMVQCRCCCWLQESCYCCDRNGRWERARCETSNNLKQLQYRTERTDRFDEQWMHRADAKLEVGLVPTDGQAPNSSEFFLMSTPLLRMNCQKFQYSF